MLPWPEDQPDESVNIYEFQPLIDSGANDDIRRCLKVNRSMIRDYSCPDTCQDCRELRFYISPVADSDGGVSGAMVFVENSLAAQSGGATHVGNTRKGHLLLGRYTCLTLVDVHSFQVGSSVYHRMDRATTAIQGVGKV